MDAARLRRPLLGDGEVGAFVAPDGTRTPWRIESGTPRQYADRWGPEPLARPMPPVDVLTGPRTASAGEAVAIAFRGRPDTRSFGEPTFGVPTANAPYLLSDGALVVLTTARSRPTWKWSGSGAATACWRRPPTGSRPTTAAENPDRRQWARQPLTVGSG